MKEMYGHLGLQAHNTISYGAKQIQYIVQHCFLICNFYLQLHFTFAFAVKCPSEIHI